ncbi:MULTISPECIES: hypothetical protein [unclassified Pseudomonas]|uniref:hypothetical protein n=1 Tax=unclassified Pseudomonas TaxID=196821 RepID=UPI000A1EB52C|nr:MULTISPECIES: hypothetical protein [unclassified Pseudomonas]
MSNAKNQVGANISYTLDGTKHSFSTKRVSGSTQYVLVFSEEPQPKTVSFQFPTDKVPKGKNTYPLKNLPGVLFAFTIRDEYRIAQSGDLELEVEVVDNEYYVITGTIIKGKLSNGIKDLDLEGRFSYTFP